MPEGTLGTHAKGQMAATLKQRNTDHMRRIAVLVIVGGLVNCSRLGQKEASLDRLVKLEAGKGHIVGVTAATATTVMDDRTTTIAEGGAATAVFG